MSLPPAQYYVGLDWAAQTHAVCVLTSDGQTVERFTIAHSADGISRLVTKLANLGDPIDTQVGLERPDGRLVDLLLEAGHDEAADGTIECPIGDQSLGKEPAAIAIAIASSLLRDRSRV